MIDILIADDDVLVRGGIAMLLAGESDVRLVGQAGSGEEAVRLAYELRPTLVLMDLRMPGLDGVEATRRIVDEPTLTGDEVVRVLVLTTFSDDESLHSALRAGASGFLIKDAAPRFLVEAIRSVAAGASWLDAAVAGQVIRALAAAPHPSSPNVDEGAVGRLTAREREVLQLMAAGRSNAEIRDLLVLSEATVRTHVSRILMKTGSRDRTQAVVLAYRSGLVDARV